MKVRVNVTWNDIKNGQRRDTNNCALALAVKRRVRNSVQVAMGRTVAAFGGSFVDLPEPAVLFVRKFDTNKKAVCPTSFTLDIPKRFLKK